MNRLRKKSDGHHSQLSQSSVLDGQFSIDALPQLLTTNDFRTSLILPDLSRRFSLLRSSTSDPAAFDNHLRNRLADQRARGAENQITEEEEDMLLDALGRLRTRHHTTADRSQESLNGTDAASGASGVDENERKSSTPSASTTNVSPNGRSGKRYSNNLFGSGRLRDYSYLKTISSSKSSSSSTRTVSLTPTEVSVKKMSTSSLLPVTPERTITPPISSQVSPITDVDTDEDGTTQYHLEAVESQLESQLGPSDLRRASMALQQAIKEIEDELEEEILLPRTTPIPRGNLDQVIPEDRESHSSASSIFEGGMAISIDKSLDDDPNELGASPIPARMMPGYVPGMPRPMTPRDVDLEEQRSHSTTPRAQSPSVMGSIAQLNAVSNGTGARRDSTSSVTRSLPVPPLFLQRSTNGRYTPTPTTQANEGERSDGSDLDSPLGTSRRRPASPLSGPSYQPMAVSSRPNSRPGTPSNVIWTPNSSLNGHGRRPSHVRNTSLTADGEMEYHGTLGMLAKPDGPRALRSPFRELEPGKSTQSSPVSNATPTQSPPNSSGRPRAIVGETESSSQPTLVQLPPRTATPTQNVQRSPASPAFGKRVSRQNQPSSPFNLSAFPGLGLSARANSSRSSLDSVGSSFHSWDEPDKVFSVFMDPNEQQLMWYEFVDLDKSNSVTPGDESDPEDVLKRFGGLKKGDIAAVQEKLVAAALMKIANIDPRDRAPSALRRRRPSTSQSNYTRIASPPPQVQPPASPILTSTDDQYSKASALLNSVVDSIKDQPSTLNPGPITKVPSTSSEDISPATRRNRALARVLFGEEDTKDSESPVPKDECIKSIPELQAVVSTPISENCGTNIIPSNAPSAFNSSFAFPSTQPSNSQLPESAYTVHRNISLTRVPQTPQQEAELVREVQKKAEAAMIALNKTSSSINLPEGLSHSSSIRRRVDPRDISKPKLVSTSNNLDALPLTQINNNGSSSKLGSRFKRLRGSLRAKSVASSGEETATPASVKTPPASQEAFYDPTKLNLMSGNAPGSSGSSDQTRFKTSVPTPPASAGPGLKGFMARFRNKQRMSETPTERPIVLTTPATAPVTPVSPPTPRSADTVVPKYPASPERSASSSSRSPGQPRPMYSRFPPANVPVAQAPTPLPQVQLPAQPNPANLQQLESPSTAQSHVALQQLFRAANDLGLDQNALTDLLSRSGSVSSRTLLQRNNSVAVSTSNPGSDVEQVSYVASTGSDQTATPANYATLSSKQDTKSDVRPITPEESTIRKPLHKSELLRRVKEGQTEANPVVRITRVYANDAPELAGLMQRKNSARRKRVSATSVSNRSVYDRVPTPPPPKASAKRFSADRMPPIPHLPNLLGQVGQPSNAPTSVQSTYDSLYDMYSWESRVGSMTVGEDGQLPSEVQPAVEVIELANGEAIWNIVNGLRDGDDASVYSRASFVSEYSAREGGSENAKLFVKGHNRPESKGSVSSFISNTKGQQGKSRPETKVFYSTSEQIGRLIESLSQGADAGSFNFLPNLHSDRPSHSKSSSMSTSDINWTVEERLERMLGAINASS